MNERILGRKWVSVAACSLVVAACATTESGGGSNTSWLDCKVDVDCPNTEHCVTGRCAPAVTQGGQAGSGAVSNAEGDAAASDGFVVRCADEPLRIVDYVPEVPDAGQSAIQVPTIAVGGDSIFYVLNWSTPLGSPEGPGAFLMRVPVHGGDPWSSFAGIYSWSRSAADAAPAITR